MTRKRKDNSLEIKNVNHPFKFKGTNDQNLKEKIVETINHMGYFGDDAEKVYQESLKKLKTDAEKVISIVSEEYKALPETQYLNRWSLIQLLAELKTPSSLSFLNDILSTPIPPEKSKAPQEFSTRGEEVIIRTTSVEAIARIATQGNTEAVKILLKHTQHENFSVKRAAIQGYLSIEIENAREILLKELPEKDRYILDIKRVDVNKIPQAHVEKVVIEREKVDIPRIHAPKPPHKTKDHFNKKNNNEKGGLL